MDFSLSLLYSASWSEELCKPSLSWPCMAQAA